MTARARGPSGGHQEGHYCDRAVTHVCTPSGTNRLQWCDQGSAGLSLGNVHHDKGLDSEGGSCSPHLPPTWLSALVTFGYGGQLHPPELCLGSETPHLVCQGGFLRLASGFPAFSRDVVAVPTHQSCDAAPAPQLPPPAWMSSLQLSTTKLWVQLCTSKFVIWKQKKNHIFVPKIMFIWPFFVHKSCHGNTVLSEHPFPTAAKP